MVVVDEVDVVVEKPRPRHTPPEYLIHKSVSESKNSCPSLGASGTELCSTIFPINALCLLVILI